MTSICSFGQSSADTLFVGQYKFPLKKVKTFFVTDKDYPVALPTKYKHIEKIRDFTFLKIDSLSYQSYTSEDGDGITIGFFSTDTLYNKSIRVMSFLDTLVFDVEKLSALKPFIKSGNSKTYMCAATICTIKNGLLTKYNVANLPSGNIFEEWNTYPQRDTQEERIKSIKATKLIVTALFYRIGNATYILDRQFAILTK